VVFRVESLINSQPHYTILSVAAISIVLSL